MGDLEPHPVIWREVPSVALQAGVDRDCRRSSREAIGPARDQRPASVLGHVPQPGIDLRIDAGDGHVEVQQWLTQKGECAGNREVPASAWRHRGRQAHTGAVSRVRAGDGDRVRRWTDWVHRRGGGRLGRVGAEDCAVGREACPIRARVDGASGAGTGRDLGGCVEGRCG